jgi:multicomponent Na+:H+ antiporter subunit G
MDLAGSLLVFLGSLLLLLAAAGVWRMPDLYNRLQAGTKASTLGLLLVFAGLAFLMPAYGPKAVLIVLFVLLTSPLASHALARTAHRTGVKPCARTEHDALQEADDRAAQEAPP